MAQGRRRGWDFSQPFDRCMGYTEVVCTVWYTVTNLEHMTTKSHFISHSIAAWSGHGVVKCVQVFGAYAYAYVLVDMVSQRP